MQVNTDLKDIITKDRVQKGDLTAKLKLAVSNSNSFKADLQISRENCKSLGRQRDNNSKSIHDA
jgi:hypothetical protein